MMKKSIAGKIAVLGVIGVMTMAGASAAFAAQSTTTYMTDYEAESAIEQAKEQGEYLGLDENSYVLVKQGEDTYTYHFYKTDEQHFDRMYDDEDDAKGFAEAEHLHNVKTEKLYFTEGLFPWLTKTHMTGDKFYGNLVVTLKNTGINSLTLNPVNGIDTIQPNGLAIIKCSVNEGADSSTVTFTSDDESVATVDWDGECAYVTGHSVGTAVITATAPNNVTSSITICVSEN